VDSRSQVIILMMLEIHRNSLEATHHHWTSSGLYSTSLTSPGGCWRLLDVHWESPNIIKHPPGVHSRSPEITGAYFRSQDITWRILEVPGHSLEDLEHTPVDV
jgi:hypothetical protein